MITIIPMLLVVSNTQNVDPYSNFFAIHSKVANPQAPQTFQIGYWRLTNKKGHQIRNFTPSEKKTALAIILLNLLAGLLYRGLILKNIIKTGSLTPCNIMTGILRAWMDWSFISHALHWNTHYFRPHYLRTNDVAGHYGTRSSLCETGTRLGSISKGSNWNWGKQKRVYSEMSRLAILQ